MPRLVRASAKMTRISPAVAMTCENRCAGEARWWVLMLTAASSNIPLATMAPVMQPPTWRGA